jgi:glycerol-3-phosphate dehydrogenase (NAD+)
LILWLSVHVSLQVRGADILIFCAPHQFIRSMCKQLIGKIKPDAFAVSLIKVGRCTEQQ